ncbi:MAG: hypothetical protein JRF55_18180 [Deltaproteobacteria bacterium]|nr:hypothetical protein [Deltaproteobacteria bacterium]
MRRLELLALALLAMLASCTSQPERGGERGHADSPSEIAGEQSAKRPTVTRNYDAKGGLLPSDEYVVGIRLPRGAELFRESELEHVYRILAPIDKVLAYFGPMMITGNVERRGKGAIYKRASVRGAEVKLRPNEGRGQRVLPDARLRSSKPAIGGKGTLHRAGAE